MTADFSIYAQRRARLAAQLGAGGIAIVPTAPEQQRNRDSDFLFRHDSYFYYLTGFTEPNAWLVLTADGESTLFCNPKDAERETWDGLRLGPLAAPGALGVSAAFSSAELDAQLPKMLENRSAVWYPFATHKTLAGRVNQWLDPVRARVRYGALCPEQQRDLCGPLDEMRLIKDAHEQVVMRRATQISAQAHIRAMQRSAAMLRRGEDVREYHLDAELLHEFRQQGSQYPAYGSIVGAGSNACVLHYRDNNARAANGDLVLIDAGAEFRGYAADITRTFPVNGRFTAPQRALHDLVGAAQAAALAQARPGIPYEAGHLAAVETLTEGLLQLGLLKGKLEKNISSGEYKRFYRHKTGHWLGLDVHDVGEYRLAGDSRQLEPGMVFTIEPGLYVSADDTSVDAKWRGIGIRTEDDVLVTANEPVVLTDALARSADEIEALMAAAH